jgi:hypothetical protein
LASTERSSELGYCWSEDHEVPDDLEILEAADITRISLEEAISLRHLLLSAYFSRISSGRRARCLVLSRYSGPLPVTCNHVAKLLCSATDFL